MINKLKLRFDIQIHFPHSLFAIVGLVWRKDIRIQKSVNFSGIIISTERV